MTKSHVITGVIVVIGVLVALWVKPKLDAATAKAA